MAVPPLAPSTYRWVRRATGGLLAATWLAAMGTALVAWRSSDGSSSTSGWAMGLFLVAWGLHLLVRPLDPARRDEPSTADDGHRGPLVPPSPQKAP